MTTSGNAGRARKARWHLWLKVVAVLLVLYSVGYFVLMDRHLPTSPFRNANEYFESSFRWAAKQRAGKGTGPKTNFPDVTIWNVVYDPVDRIFFHLFPRPMDEVERLKALGYYR